MRTNNCKFCGKDFLTEDNFSSNCCQNCMKPKEIGNPVFTERVFLGQEYGYELKSRVKEALKRRILPYEKKGGYYVGSFEKGKIHEREPRDI